ncbi:MAG TPA: hypothetical protein VLS28_04880 [Candidatus Sulfomarinibacteraceae bacterium]|nr:hypothetical protein [Candidatus Sulfomarinibacteraceae bacterium]
MIGLHPNPIRHRISIGLQWTGLAGSVVGFVSVPLFLGFQAQWLVAGAIAVALDVVAIRTASDTRAMLAALGKLVILVVALMVLTTPGSIPAMAPGSIPPDTGPVVLLISILPSELGAMLRRAPVAEPGIAREPGIPPGLQS